MQLLETAKAELFRSNADRKHPFRFFFLATSGSYPELRTVVQRQVDPNLQVLFYTDSRSPKVAQMQQQPEVSALFWHPKKQLQVRLKGAAQFIDASHPEYVDYLARVQQSPSTKDYRSLQAPGTALGKGEAPAYGAQWHFLAVLIQPHELDVLQLQREQHLRCRYRLQAGHWQEEPLAP